MLDVGGGRLGPLPLLQRGNCLSQTYCVFKLYFLEKGKSRINCRQGARLPKSHEKADALTKWQRYLTIKACK